MTARFLNLFEAPTEYLLAFELSGYSSGQHSFGDEPDIPAGNPLDYPDIEFSSPFTPSLAARLAGSAAAAIPTSSWGSFHEESLTVSVYIAVDPLFHGMGLDDYTSPKLPPISGDVRLWPTSGDEPFRFVFKSVPDAVAQIRNFYGGARDEKSGTAEEWWAHQIKQAEFAHWAKKDAQRPREGD